MQVGEKNEKGHLCIAKVGRRPKTIAYVTNDGWVFEYISVGRTNYKKVK